MSRPVLFTADAWPGLADGTITVTFRRWKSPQAKAGARYRVAGLLLEAVAVAQVPAGSISDHDAVAAGEPDVAALIARLGHPAAADLVWRVDLRCVGRDDRIDRRERPPTAQQLADLRARLDRLDRHAPAGAWTRSTLRLIERYPGVVSTTLASHAGQERPAFKLNVRKLKELGLTESLDTGYRLSPLGVALLRELR